MLTDAEIQDAREGGDLGIDPFVEGSLASASYDCRVGDQAFVSGSDEITDVANKGLVIIEPGELAMLVTKESVLPDGSRSGTRSRSSRCSSSS